MKAEGYAAARTKGETVARALRDMAMLLGEPASGEIELETGGEIVPGLGLRDDAAALALRARDLEQGLFKIIVVGEFKNGKSTLLNGMLGSKTLPAKAAPATAIITLLVYGESDQVAVYESNRSTNGGSPRRISWERFVQEFQLSRQDQETLQEHGSIDRFRDVEYAQIECRHPICAEGVKLVDTPGLGEHVSRSRVATNFLKQSQAVICVLNATRILDRDERDFIDNVLGPGRLPHVFFVVNRINQVDPAAIPEIRDWVEQGLAPHFQDAQGNFDRDLYDRRVFFVDAKGALDARADIGRPVAPSPAMEVAPSLAIPSPTGQDAAETGRPQRGRPTPPTMPDGVPAPDETLVEATGVPALERELERFLTGEGKVAAALQSTVQVLRPMVARAQRRIADDKAALDQPLTELEERRAQAEDRLIALEGRKAEIERTILLFAETVQHRVYTDLVSFIDELEVSWPDDSRHLIDLDRALTLKNLLTSYAQAEAREEMAAAIGEQVQRYLQLKFEQWAERIPGVIEHDVAMMLAEVEAQVDEFELELDQIASLFVGAPRSGPRPQAAEGLLRLALSLSDIAGMTDTIMDPGDWTRIVARMAQQAILSLIVGLFLGNFLFALLIVQAIHLGLHENELRKRIRETLGQKLHERLREEASAKQAFIEEAVAQRFRVLAASMTGAIQSQIDEVRAEQERILAQKRDERFSVEREQQRLDAVGAKLEELATTLRRAAIGH